MYYSCTVCYAFSDIYKSSFLQCNIIALLVIAFAVLLRLHVYGMNWYTTV